MSEEAPVTPLSELIGYLELFLPALWACAGAESVESLRTARVEWHRTRSPFTKRFPGFSGDAEDVLFANAATFLSCDMAEKRHQHIIDEAVVVVIDLGRTPLLAISPVLPIANDANDAHTPAQRLENEEGAWATHEEDTARLRRARLLLTRLRKLSALWLASSRGGAKGSSKKDAATLPPASPVLAMTEAKKPKEWCDIFDTGWDTLKKRFEAQQICNEKLSTKSYRVAIDDLPDKHKAKFTGKPPS